MPETPKRRILARSFGRELSLEECETVSGGIAVTTYGPPVSTNTPVLCTTDYPTDIVEGPDPAGPPEGPDSEPEEPPADDDGGGDNDGTGDDDNGYLQSS